MLKKWHFKNFGSISTISVMHVVASFFTRIAFNDFYYDLAKLCLCSTFFISLQTTIINVLINVLLTIY